MNHKVSGLSLSLVNVDGKELFFGTVQDLIEFMVKPEQKELYAKIDDTSWRNREDVVVLCMTFNPDPNNFEDQELCSFDPEITRQFLCQLPYPKDAGRGYTPGKVTYFP